MKKLFITLTAAIAAMSASAATYNDQIATEGCKGTQDAQVIITPAADGTYSFTLNEWTCMTSYLTGIGCFTLDGLTATVADGVTTITGTGNADFKAGQTPGVMMWFCSYCSNAPVTVTAKFTADKCYAEVATTMNMYGMENSYSATFGTDDFATTALRALTAAPAASQTFDLQGRRTSVAAGLRINGGKLTLTR